MLSDFLAIGTVSRDIATADPATTEYVLGGTVSFAAVTAARLGHRPVISLSYRVLPSIFERAGLRVEVSQEDVAPHVHLPARYESYLRQIDKKQRHEIRRKQRRAERELEVDFRLIQSMDELQEAMDGFLRLQRMSRPDKE